MGEAIPCSPSLITLCFRGCVKNICQMIENLYEKKKEINNFGENNIGIKK